MASRIARKIAAWRMRRAPEANGRPMVRVTLRSSSRSHMSLTTQPAPRIRKLPRKNKAISHSVCGHGAFASSSDQSPGKNSSQAPIGRSSRASNA